MLFRSRRALGIPDTGPIIGTIRDAATSTALLRDAVARVPGARLMVIGEAAGADIAPGRVSDADLPIYLAAADVLALPLDDNLVNRGRWPHKLGDMLAAERPVVVGAGGEFPALIEARRAGVIAEHHPVAFATAFADIIRYPGMYEPVARRGRQLIETELCWDVIGVELADAVERAVTLAGRRTPTSAAASARRSRRDSAGSMRTRARRSRRAVRTRRS